MEVLHAHRYFPASFADCVPCTASGSSLFLGLCLPGRNPSVHHKDRLRATEGGSCLFEYLGLTSQIRQGELNDLTEVRLADSYHRLSHRKRPESRANTHRLFLGSFCFIVMLYPLYFPYWKATILLRNHSRVSFPGLGHHLLPPVCHAYRLYHLHASFLQKIVRSDLMEKISP